MFKLYSLRIHSYSAQIAKLTPPSCSGGDFKSIWVLFVFAHGCFCRFSKAWKFEAKSAGNAAAKSAAKSIGKRLKKMNSKLETLTSTRGTSGASHSPVNKSH